jgi:hypothetical protein
LPAKQIHGIERVGVHAVGNDTHSYANAGSFQSLLAARHGCGSRHGPTRTSSRPSGGIRCE